MTEPQGRGTYAVRLRGQGRAEVAGYGIADAEHLVEKEIGRAWPDARVEVTGVERAGAGGRIVEQFVVSYRVTATVRVEAATAEQAPGAAFRAARGLLAGTRYARTEWEKETERS